MQEKIKEILKRHGEKKQILKSIEEMAELQNVLLHVIDGRDSVDHVREEIADVSLMMKQMQIVFNLPDAKLNERMQEKAERELDRLGVKFSPKRGSDWQDVKDGMPDESGQYIVMLHNDKDTFTRPYFATWYAEDETWMDSDGDGYDKYTKWRNEDSGMRILEWMAIPPRKVEE